MPAKSKKQQKFMAAVANNPKFAKKVGVPQSVGEEFMKAKKYQMGGRAMGNRPMGGRAMGNRAMGNRPMGGRPMGNLSDEKLHAMEEARGKPRAPRRRAPVTGGPTPRPSRPSRPPMPGGPSRGLGMKSGGKVRGCGKATKGVRKAKMVSMKGS